MEAGTCVVEGCGRPRVRRQGAVYRPVCWVHQTQGREGVGVMPVAAAPRPDGPLGRFPWRPPLEAPIVRDAEGRMLGPDGHPLTAAETYEADEAAFWAALRWLGQNAGRVPALREDRILIRRFMQTLVRDLSAWVEGGDRPWGEQGDPPDEADRQTA